jgi:hypothetical protein
MTLHNKKPKHQRVDTVPQFSFKIHMTIKSDHESNIEKPQ